MLFALGSLVVKNLDIYALSFTESNLSSDKDILSTKSILFL